MSRFICDRCGMTIPPHAHYVVKMEVYADPSLPAVSSDDLEETDYASRTADLLREMEGMSAQELEDAVHWRREFKICRPCQAGLLKNPLGAAESGSSA
jgi:ribosomal protein L40E